MGTEWIFGEKSGDDFLFGHKDGNDFLFGYPSAAGSGVVTSGLLAWWKQNEGSGLVINDFSGNGYDGVPVGANFWGETGPDGSAVGSYGADTRYVHQIGTGLGFSDEDSLTFVICFNTNLINNSSHRELLSRYVGTGPYSDYLLILIKDDDEIGLQISTSEAGGERYASSDLNVATSTWYIWSVSYTCCVGSTAAMYVNGASQAASWTLQDGDGTKQSGTGYTILGALDNSNPPDDVADVQFFNGLMGDVLIYNRILTPAEHLQNFDALKGRYLL